MASNQLPSSDVQQSTNVNNDTLAKLAECPVCQENFVRPWILPCTHNLCTKCMQRWMFMDNDKRCPLCKESFLTGKHHVMRNRSLEQIVNHLFPETEIDQTAFEDKRNSGDWVDFNITKRDTSQNLAITATFESISRITNLAPSDLDFFKSNDFKRAFQLAKDTEVLFLHCYGDPGTGKKEIVRHLGEKFPYRESTRVVVWCIDCDKQKHNLRNKLYELAKEMSQKKVLNKEKKIGLEILSEMKSDNATKIVDVFCSCSVPLLIIVENLKVTDQKFFQNFFKNVKATGVSQFHVYITTHDQNIGLDHEVTKDWQASPVSFFLEDDIATCSPETSDFKGDDQTTSKSKVENQVALQWTKDGEEGSKIEEQDGEKPKHEKPSPEESKSEEEDQGAFHRQEKDQETFKSKTEDLKASKVESRAIQEFKSDKEELEESNEENQNADMDGQKDLETVKSKQEPLETSKSEEKDLQAADIKEEHLEACWSEQDEINDCTSLKIYKSIEIKGFTDPEGVQYLTDSPSTLENTEAATELVKMFSGLPISLYIIKKFCSSVRIDINEYRKCIEYLVYQNTSDPLYFVVTTLFPMIEDLSSSKVLTSLAYLHHSQIPRFLIDSLFLETLEKPSKFTKILSGQFISKLVNFGLCSKEKTTSGTVFTFNESVLKVFHLKSNGYSLQYVKDTIFALASVSTKDIRNPATRVKMDQLLPHIQYLLDHCIEIEKQRPIFPKIEENKFDWILNELVLAYLLEVYGSLCTNLTVERCRLYLEIAIKKLWDIVLYLTKKSNLFDFKANETESTQKIAQKVVELCKQAGQSLPSDFIAKFYSKIVVFASKGEFEFLEESSVDKEKFRRFCEKMKDSATLNPDKISTLQDCGLFLSNDVHKNVFFAERLAMTLHSKSRCVLFDEKVKESSAYDPSKWHSKLAYEIAACVSEPHKFDLLSKYLANMGGYNQLVLECEDDKNTKDLKSARQMCVDALQGGEQRMYEHGLVRETNTTASRIQSLRNLIRINTRLINSKEIRDESFREECDGDCATLIKISKENVNIIPMASRSLIYCAKYLVAVKNVEDALECFDHYFEKIKMEMKKSEFAWVVLNYLRLVKEEDLRERMDDVIHICEEILESDIELQPELNNSLNQYLHEIKEMKLVFSCHGDSTSKVVGKSGDIIKVFGCVVNIPEGALDKDVRISVGASYRKRKNKEYMDITAELYCKPDGLIFKKPVQITLPTCYFTEKEPLSVEILIKKADKKWVPFKTGTLGKSKLISFETNHFSGFLARLYEAIMGPKIYMKNMVSFGYRKSADEPLNETYLHWQILDNISNKELNVEPPAHWALREKLDIESNNKDIVLSIEGAGYTAEPIKFKNIFSSKFDQSGIFVVKSNLPEIPKPDGKIFNFTLSNAIHNNIIRETKFMFPKQKENQVEVAEPANMYVDCTFNTTVVADSTVSQSPISSSGVSYEES